MTMMIRSFNTSLSIVLLLLLLFVQQIVTIDGYSNSNWFYRQSATTTPTQSQATTTTISTIRYNTRLYNTGGWGVGPQREMVPEEFARRSDNKRIFEGYELRDRSDFNRQLRADKDSMIKNEMEELLGVAQMAGIKVKNPKDRLNKFEPELFTNDDDYNDDDNNDIDVRLVTDDDDDDDDDSSNINNKRSVRRSDESITRLDEDTGALGVW